LAGTGKNISKMTYFVSSGTYNLNSIDPWIMCMDCIDQCFPTSVPQHPWLLWAL